MEPPCPSPDLPAQVSSARNRFDQVARFLIGMVSGHCPDGVAFEVAAALGMSSFEHLQGVATEHLRDEAAPLPLVEDLRWEYETAVAVTERLDLLAVERLGEFLAAGRVWNCPTLTMTSSRSDDLSRGDDDTRLRHVREATLSAWAGAVAGRFGPVQLSDRERARLSAALDDRYVEIVSILYRRGAPLLVGTDASNPFVVPGFSIHDELRRLHQAGLDRYEVLRIATTVAADFVGEAAATGTVEVGKRADLLLLDRNPLEDLGG
jgi:hypothetical protein